jgi:hypothetical protein
MALSAETIQRRSIQTCNAIKHVYFLERDARKGCKFKEKNKATKVQMFYLLVDRALSTAFCI